MTDPGAAAGGGGPELAARVRDVALRLLAPRPRSRSEMEDRLARKGFPAPAVAVCVARLTREGLLDDDAFARAFVRDRVRLRPRGRRGLLAELRRRGVPEPVAAEAVEAVFLEEETDEARLAVDTALGWLRKQPRSARTALAEEARSPERERVRRRLWSHLARRGFTGDSVAKAVDGAVARAGDRTAAEAGP